jgi:hypothetical protein
MKTAEWASAGEQMVLAPQRDGSDRAFDGIVVELDTAVVQEMTEGRPAGKGVTDRVGQTPAARNATELRLEPRLHCLDERPRFGITPAAAVFGGAPADRLFDRIELGDAAQGFGRDWRTLMHRSKQSARASKVGWHFESWRIFDSSSSRSLRGARPNSSTASTPLKRQKSPRERYSKLQESEIGKCHRGYADDHGARPAHAAQATHEQQQRGDGRNDKSDRLHRKRIKHKGERGHEHVPGLRGELKRLGCCRKRSQHDCCARDEQ